MEPLMQFEIAVSLAIQSIGVWLHPLMALASFLGTESFYLAMVPLLYWCVNPTLGLSIGVMLMFTNVVNSGLKLALHSPRPYWVDPQVKALAAETSFGMPSGHSQNAASLWGLVAARIGRKWAIWPAVCVVFIIGFSRLYLGVHFLRDVLSGWLIGAGLLFVFLKVEAPLIRWFRGLSLFGKIAAAFLSAVGVIAFGLGVAWMLHAYVVPAAWLQNALAAAPEAPIDPLSLNGIFTGAGTWFGLAAGVSLLLHGPGLVAPSKSMLQRAVCYVLGVAVMLALYAGLGSIFPRNADWISFGLRFLRYTAIGLWVSAGAPWMFLKLKLTQPQG